MKMSIYEFTSLKFKIVFCDNQTGETVDVCFYPTEIDEWETVIADECEYDINLWLDTGNEDDFGIVKFIAYRVVPKYEDGHKLVRYWSTEEIVCDSDCNGSTITVIPISDQDLCCN